MKPIEKHPNLEPELRLKDEKKTELAEWLYQELTDGMAARSPQDMLWRELTRMYEAVPKQEIRDTPIINAPNFEMAIGATACDSINGQVIDLIYQITPVLTVRGLDERYVEDAKAIQRFVNWLADTESKMRPASEQAILDNIILGTGILYVPWVEKKRKTKVMNTKAMGPMIRCIAPEDFLVPGGIEADLQECQWVAARFYMTKGELSIRAKLAGWKIDEVQPVPNVSWVRSRRETLGRTMSNKRIANLYEIYEVYCYYDIDGDGVEEDLLVTIDLQSRSILQVRYNPYDLRPFEAMRYQLRAHLFNGISAMEMLKPFEEAVTELTCHWILNLMLANTRIWKARDGVVPENTKMWPSKVITMADPMTDLVPEQLGDVYPSAPGAVSAVMAFAERRVGTSDLSNPRPGSLVGNRTPGITALSLMQNVNRRFTPAFDGMRLALAGAVRQCVWRYQERLLAGDTAVEEKLATVFGPADGSLIIAQLKRKDFDESFAIELTASSASINRDADKQNAIMLIQILSQYYQRTIELTMMAANPQVPDAVRSVCEKVATAMGEAVDRTIRTFDSMRDPTAFVIDMAGELEALRGIDASSLIAQLNQQMGSPPVQPGAEGGGPPVGGVPGPESGGV